LSLLLSLNRDGEMVRTRREDRSFSENVLPHIEKFFSVDQAVTDRCLSKGRYFIRKLINIFSAALELSDETMQSVSENAYIINEDRFYLLPIFDLSHYISRNYGLMKPEEINTFIENIIVASRRHINNNDSLRRSDVRLYKECMSYIKFCDEGRFKICFEIKLPNAIFSRTENCYQIKAGNQTFSTTSEWQDHSLVISTCPIDIFKLEISSPRDSCFVTQKFELIANNQCFCPTDYYCGEQGYQMYI
jgi:hypothetical protein